MSVESSGRLLGREKRACFRDRGMGVFCRFSFGIALAGQFHVIRTGDAQVRSRGRCAHVFYCLERSYKFAG